MAIRGRLTSDDTEDTQNDDSDGARAEFTRASVRVLRQRTHSGESDD